MHWRVKCIGLLDFMGNTKRNWNENQMCCIYCGYIAQLNEEYVEVENNSIWGNFPICPKCGDYDIGSIFPSYATIKAWRDPKSREILLFHQDLLRLHKKI